jgi:EAL domain-containing protein (putative c-di-GMP-specific phosphodiesterase class I)
MLLSTRTGFVSFARRATAGTRGIRVPSCLERETERHMSQPEARISELEAQLAFFEESQRAGRVGSWRARIGPESVLELTEESRRILGIGDGTVLRNLDFYLMLHPGDRDRFLETIIVVRTERVRHEVDVRLLCPDGGERLLRVSAAPASDDPSCVTGTIADVSDSRHRASDTDLQVRLDAERDLRRALQAEEFFLEFQPVASLEGARYLGVEALVRWRHPDRGRVEPIEFIPLAEESGIIFGLGEWVLKSACREFRRWQDVGIPEGLVLAVNLSAVQLRTHGLPETIENVLAETGVAGSSLLLEITESVLVEGSLDERSLGSIRDLGVRIAIDDFGTKYSNLNYLARLPVDAIKIDASFVHATDNQAGRAVVIAIAALGRALDLSVTAEGIETHDQLAAVRAAGCTGAQGFLISPPLGAGECLAALRSDGGRVP